MEYLDSSQGFC